MNPELFELELEAERYELYAAPAYRFEMTRRDLFQILGGGLLVLCLLVDADAQESGGGRRRGGFGGNQPRDIGAWLHIGEDGAVTAFTGKVECGQNARTLLTQVVAEELRVTPAVIKMVMADTALTPFDAGTFGSRTTPTMAPQLRQAAVAARERLLDLAAETWKANRATLQIADGKITDPHARKTLDFGALTKGRKWTEAIRADVAVTPPAQWKIEGTSVPKVNGRDIVTGKHQYTTDVRRPGMLTGKILRPAALNATLTSADITRAQAIPGVTVVRDGEFVGVAAPDASAASRALEAIKAEWKTTPQSSSKELFEVLKKPIEEDGRQRRDSGFTQGTIEEGMAQAEAKLQQTYTVAYIAHAPLEPRAAVAEWNEDKLTVWTGTQRPFGVRGELAQAFGIPEERIRVIVPDTGSGYGGKHTGEAAIEAARLAKAAGKPVKLVWTREEEFTWAYFRPAGVIEVSGGARKDGTLTAWEFHNFNSGGSAIRTLYTVPHQKIAFHPSQSPLRQGSYRGLAATANHFARESFMDELAHAVQREPLAFRLKNLKDERLRAVLEAAAERFGWNEKKRAADRGIGIAGGSEKGSYVATCVEVAVERPSGKVRLVRAVTAFECGAVVNPDHLRDQVEGAVVQGLGGALTEAIAFEDGKILNPRFSRYRVPRFSDVPALETVLLDRKDLPSAGAGETPIVAIAPAIGNAIFQATGKRLRALPMLPNGV